MIPKGSSRTVIKRIDFTCKYRLRVLETLWTQKRDVGDGGRGVSWIKRTNRQETVQKQRAPLVPFNDGNPPDRCLPARCLDRLDTCTRSVAGEYPMPFFRFFGDNGFGSPIIALAGKARGEESRLHGKAPFIKSKDPLSLINVALINT